MTDDLRRRPSRPTTRVSASWMPRSAAWSNALDRLGLAETRSSCSPATTATTWASTGSGRNKALFEESARVPLLIVAPGVRPARVASCAHRSATSICIPTLAELSGVRPRPTAGQSLVPLLRDPSRPAAAGRSRQVTAAAVAVAAGQEGKGKAGERPARRRARPRAAGVQSRFWLQPAHAALALHRVGRRPAGPRALRPRRRSARTHQPRQPARPRRHRRHASAQLQAAVKTTFPPSGKVPELNDGTGLPSSSLHKTHERALFVAPRRPVRVRPHRRGRARAERKPNVVLIMADDFGYECVTANGGQSYQTPHLDRLAATGMRFERCYVQPLCTPTRVQLMTGIYNVRNYIEFGLLDPKATTFAHLLKKAGYATGIAASGSSARTKTSRSTSASTNRTSGSTRAGRRATPIPASSTTARGRFQHRRIRPETRQRLRPRLRHPAPRAPLLPLLPDDPHARPFQPTPDSADWDPKTKSEQLQRDVKHFADMTAYMDKMIGRLVAKLDELGLRENTLVMFIGDNGTGVSVTSRFKGHRLPGRQRHRHRARQRTCRSSPTGRRKSRRPRQRRPDRQRRFPPTMCEAAGTTVPAALRDRRPQFPPAAPRPARPAARLVYVWYARNGGRDRHARVRPEQDPQAHRDGRLYDLVRDPFENKPLPLASLTGTAATEAKKLQAVLDDYAKARPAHLAAHSPTKAKAGKKAGTK
jgi:arylsulfatase A